MLFLTASIGVGQMGVDVLALDGSVYATIPISTKQDEFSFVDDTVNNKVINTGYTNVGNVASMRFYESIDEGDVVISGAMEGGTDDVVQTEDMQCVEEKYVVALIEHLKAECGCPDCGNTADDDGSVVPPIIGGINVYYGSSDDDALIGTEIEALTIVSVASFATDYAYPLVDPDQYQYIAMPVTAGVPSRFYDPDTGFDIAMNTVYQAIINYQNYNVWRTYYPIGGGFTLRLDA